MDAHYIAGLFDGGIEMPRKYKIPLRPSKEANPAFRYGKKELAERTAHMRSFQVR